jgi:hypothetical protein
MDEQAGYPASLRSRYKALHLRHVCSYFTIINPSIFVLQSSIQPQKSTLFNSANPSSNPFIFQSFNMKFLSIALALMAATAATAAPGRTAQKWCGHPGQGCAKRSAEPEAMPEPEPVAQKWCAHPGQGCYMMKRTADVTTEVKRSADALAEAMAEAHPAALQKWCAHPGQGCAKVKRAAEAVEEVKRSADALAEAIASINDEE